MGPGMSAFHVITGTVFSLAVDGIQKLDSGTVGVLVMLVSLLGMLCALALPDSWRTGA